jgi:hypothetical protein
MDVVIGSIIAGLLLVICVGFGIAVFQLVDWILSGGKD